MEKTEEQASRSVRAWGFSGKGSVHDTFRNAGSTRRSRTLVHALYPIAERADKARDRRRPIAENQAGRFATESKRLVARLE